MSLLRIIKNQTLPLAMLLGTAAYFLLADVACLAPLKPVAWRFVGVATPLLIFLMLFFTFCRVSPRQVLPVRWHALLLGLQSAAGVAVALWLVLARPAGGTAALGQGVLACVVCPTAMAAAVITGKLGGNAGSLTAYTLESNLLSAVLITLLFPLVNAGHGVPSATVFAALLTKVVALLLVPFVAAQAVRRYLPRLHAVCLALKDAAFYLWACSLTMVMAQALRIVFINLGRPLLVGLLAAAATGVCCAQFAVGRAVGARYGERISGGQALGQKNTVFGIWITLLCLESTAAVALGAYVVAQNVINSWQLWRKRKNDTARGVAAEMKGEEQKLVGEK